MNGKRRTTRMMMCLLLAVVTWLPLATAQLEREQLISVPRLHGVVTTKKGEPVANAKVSLVRNDKVVAAVTTDERGRYRFEHVEGRYTLAISDGQHSPASHAVEVEWKVGKMVAGGDVYVLLGPGACAESCSMVTTSKSEVKQIVARNNGHGA